MDKPQHNLDDASPEELEERKILYANIALTLEKFSILEESLAALFGVVSRIEVLETAFLSHMEIRDVATRISMTSKVLVTEVSEGDLAADLKTEILKEWKSLERQIKECSKDRNKLAHFRIYAGRKDGKQEVLILPYFQPFAFFSSLTKGGPPEGITRIDADSLRQKAEKMIRAKNRTDALIAKLVANGYQLPKPRRPLNPPNTE